MKSFLTILAVLAMIAFTIAAFFISSISRQQCEAPGGYSHQENHYGMPFGCVHPTPTGVLTP